MSRVLMVTLDQSFLDKTSQSVKRLRAYAVDCERVDVLVLGQGKKTMMQVSPNISVVRPGGQTKIGVLWRGLREVRKSAKIKPYTIIDCQDPFFTAYVGREARLPGSRFLVEIHGDFWNPSPRYAVSWWRKRLAAFCLRQADGIRVVSQRVLQNIEREFPDLENKKILLLPVSTPRPSAVSTQTDARHDSSRVQVLFVGRLSPEKGLEHFLPIFANVAHDVQELSLRIVGDGQLRSRLERQVNDLGLSDRVEFTGWQPDPSIFFQDANFLVLPSDHESWGRVAIEALTYRLPVLMTDVGCAGEVVRSEVSGLVVPVGDDEAMTRALRRIATDADLRQRLSSHAAEAVAALPTWEETVRLYRQFWLGS